MPSLWGFQRSGAVGPVRPAQPPGGARQEAGGHLVLWLLQSPQTSASCAACLVGQSDETNVVLVGRAAEVFQCPSPGRACLEHKVLQAVDSACQPAFAKTVWQKAPVFEPICPETVEETVNAAALQDVLDLLRSRTARKAAAAPAPLGEGASAGSQALLGKDPGPSPPPGSAKRQHPGLTAASPEAKRPRVDKTAHKQAASLGEEPQKTFNKEGLGQGAPNPCAPKFLLCREQLFTAIRRNALHLGQTDPFGADEAAATSFAKAWSLQVGKAHDKAVGHHVCCEASKLMERLGKAKSAQTLFSNWVDAQGVHLQKPDLLFAV